MTDASTTKRHSRKGLYAPFILVLIALAAWTGLLAALLGPVAGLGQGAAAQNACPGHLSATALAPLQQRIEKLLRDVKLNMIYEGTSDIQRLVISRNLGGSD